MEVQDASEVQHPLHEVQLAAPLPGARWIRRTELVRRLSSLSDEVPLVLVVAPPGYGKTTAVRQWAQTTRSRVAWVLASREHRDRQRLVRDLALALLQVGP